MWTLVIIMSIQNAFGVFGTIHQVQGFQSQAVCQRAAAVVRDNRNLPGPSLHVSCIEVK